MKDLLRKLPVVCAFFGVVFSSRAHAQAPVGGPVAPSEYQDSEPLETDAQNTDHEGETPYTKDSLFDLVAFGGSLMPLGDLKDSVKADSTYGIALGKAIYFRQNREVRINFLAGSQTKLKAKDSDHEGSLSVQFYNIRGDYVFAGGRVNPFVGLGLGTYVWEDTVKARGGRPKSGKKNDLGGMGVLGLDIVATHSLIVAPEIAYHRIGGDFAAPLLSGTLSLRWRFAAP